MNVMHCVGLCFCPYYLGFDTSLLTGLQALPQWNAYFGTPTGTWLGVITALISFPAILSSFLGDILARPVGRKPILWLGTSLIIVGALINTFAVNVGMYIAGRVLLGFGGGMAKVLAPTLLQEIAHPRLRPRMSGIYYCFNYIGSIIAAWFTFGTLHMGHTTWAWRVPSIFQLFGPIMVFSLTLTAPESPRWLVKHSKQEKALAILARYHANGDSDDPLVRYEYEEILQAIQLEEGAKQVTYGDFFRTKPNLHRLSVLILVSLGQNWIGNGIISYYLSPILKSIGLTNPTQITGINGGLQIWNFFAALTGALNIERIGRRPLWLTSVCGMLVFNSIIMGLSAGYAHTKNHHVGIAVIPMLYLFYGFYDIAFTALSYAYASEILPFSMRTKGMAIFVASQNVGLAFNQFVNPIALAAIGWKYYGVYIAVQVCYIFFIYFLFPETKHRTIEEVSLLFDGETRELQEHARERVGKDLGDVHREDVEGGKY